MKLVRSVEEIFLWRLNTELLLHLYNGEDYKSRMSNMLQTTFKVMHKKIDVFQSMGLVENKTRVGRIKVYSLTKKGTEVARELKSFLKSIR